MGGQELQSLRLVAGIKQADMAALVDSTCHSISDRLNAVNCRGA